MATKLTAVALDTLPEGIHKDHVVPGLSFHVGKKRRTWVLRYLGQGGRQATDKLGNFVPRAPEGSLSMGLASARERAQEILARVEAGVPVAQEKVAHPKDALTLGQLFNAYEKMKRAKATKGLKSLDEAMRTVRRCCADYIDLPAHAFSKADLKAARDKAAAGLRKKGSPQMADRFMDYLSPILNWAAKEDHIDLNLVSVTHKVGPGLVKRKRVLSEAEIRKVWAATFKLDSSPEARVYGRLIRFLLCVPQRKMEAATIRHGDIIDGQWRIREEDTKSAREHRLKLPALALEQLGTGKADELCFPGKFEGKTLGGFSKFKTALDELSGVVGWRQHDLRRSATTWMQEMTGEDDMPAIPQEVVSAIMNHAIKGADAHYLHATLAKPKARALELWCTELDRIIKAGGNVIPYTNLPSGY
ncbi:DUF4102 domain-containing protein [Sinorhizobium meliloti]|uniref:tyrosine-type recombinase/integrase n=1 Tax=Rhizobium meliloti TaxID=382 RepID=UPI000FDAFCFB|nr:integrase family protein [Sinorhizobium meliloti]RVL75351.1 DUF4102 domain-containing protein [Sinorhizobium meliloti]